jgi:hypothetical protein
MAEKQPIPAPVLEAKGQPPALPFSTPNTTQPYREHVCARSCDDIPDSGMYDALNPGFNPTIERFPGDLDG